MRKGKTAKSEVLWPISYQDYSLGGVPSSNSSADFRSFEAEHLVLLFLCWCFVIIMVLSLEGEKKETQTPPVMLSNIFQMLLCVLGKNSLLPIFWDTAPHHGIYSYSVSPPCSLKFLSHSCISLKAQGVNFPWKGLVIHSQSIPWTLGKGYICALDLSKSTSCSSVVASKSSVSSTA